MDYQKDIANFPKKLREINASIDINRFHEIFFRWWGIYVFVLHCYNTAITRNEKGLLYEFHLLEFHGTFFTVRKLREFSFRHFWQKFRESNGYTKYITKELIWRNISWWKKNSVISTVWETHCGNYGILMPRFFHKKFVKSTFY